MTEFTDNTVSLEFGPHVQTTMERQALEAYPNKTGGVLVGYYTDDHSCVRVTEVLPPPPDSKSTLKEFLRGTEGLQAAMQERWDAPGRTYFLGDWHSRPMSESLPGLDIEPSTLDIQTMIELANDEGSECPQPMLIVLGICASDEKRIVNTNLGVYGFDRGSDKFFSLAPMEAS